MSRESFQHDVVVQSLYSGRCGVEHAPYFTYSLAQARADVFFALLFGGRVVSSAATFLDSPIAIRVFGELFSEPGFQEALKDGGWFPLHLNTDNPKLWKSPTDYLIARWRDPQLKLCLFRENEPDFQERLQLEIGQIKAAAADRLADGDFETLQEDYDPFLDEHLINVGHGQPEAVSTILTDDFSEWLGVILNYLNAPARFMNMDVDLYEKELSKFSPISAVQRRTAELPMEAAGDYSVEDMNRQNQEFTRSVGRNPMMNAFHKQGPGIYGHYFPLVNHWIEAEWHTTRHAAYGSATCLMSSTWQARDIFDFDTRSKIHYLVNAEIDDSLRQA